ncbi:primosomal protein N' [Aquifex sp.]
MLLKVVIPNGQTRLLEWDGAPENPLGFRVLFRTKSSGLTGIVVGYGEGEPSGRVHSFPDKLPLVLPHHIEIAKELALYYLEPYGKILWDFVPSVFDWYEDEVVSVASSKPAGLDRKSREIWEYVRRRGEVSYERLKERFGSEIVRLLIEHKILKRERKWLYPEVEEEIYQLAIPYEEALRRAKTKKQKELIEFLEERRFATREELREAGFNLRTVKSLLSAGVLKLYRDYPRALKSVPLSQRVSLKPQRGSFIFSIPYTAALRRSLNIIQKNLSEGKGTLLLFTDREELFEVSEELYSLFGDRVVEISSRIPPKGLYENWFRAQERGTVVVGSFKALFAPVKSLESVILFNELGNTKFIRNGVDIRRVSYFLSKKTGASLEFQTPFYTLESYYGVKRGIFSLREEEFDAEVKILKRKEEVLTEELYKDIEKRREESFLFLVNKTGYSYLFCPRCDGVVECPECGTFLTYSKEKEKVFCTRRASHYASEERVCPRCGGEAQELGFGVEKAKEVIEGFFGKRENWEFATFPDWKKSFDNVVILNADNILSVPSYKSHERFLEFVAHALRCARKTLFLQTGVLEEDEVKLLGEKKFRELYERELLRRKEEELPPFTRLVLIESPEDIEEVLKSTVSEDFRKVYNSKEKTWQYLLKIRSREVLRKLWELKKDRNLRIVLDWK